MASILTTPNASFAPKFKAPKIGKTKEELVSQFVKTPSKTTGGSSASKKLELQDDTKLYQDLNVTTGVGGYGEGQTVPTIESGIKTRAYRPELVKELQDTKTFESSLSESKFVTKKAKEIDENMFTATKGLSIESTIGQIKLAKVKAQKDVEDFISNPSSTIAKAFKANIDPKKYEEYKNLVDSFNTYKEGFKVDKSGAFESSGIRGLYDLPILSAVVDKATGGQYDAFTSAINEAESEGETGLTSKGAYLTSNLLGGGLLYGGIGGGVRMGLTKGLSEAGFAIEGKAGGELVKFANTIERTANKSPTLYAATVDNGLVSAIEYGVNKSLGGDYSSSDFINSLFVGAAVPMIFKGVGKVAGITQKDIFEIDKAVNTHMQTHGSTTVKEAMDGIADTHILQDGETLAKKIEVYKASTAKNPDATIEYPEVQATLAHQGKSASTRASKIIANAISKLNEKIKGDVEASGGYGALTGDNNIQLAKRAIIDNLAGERIVTAEKARLSVGNALEANGIIKTGEFHIADDIVDDVDEMFHNTSSKPEMIPEAKSMQELEVAIKGTETKPTINSVRDKIDMDGGGVDDVKALADEFGVTVNSDRILKDGKLAKAYAHEILDRVELRKSGYNPATSIALKRAKETIASAIVSIAKSTGRLKTGVVNLGKEVERVKKQTVGDILTSYGDTLTSKQITSLKNKYLAKPAGRLEDISKISQKLSEESHLISFKNLEKNADTLITKVLKAARSKTNKSIVTKDTIEEMMEFYNKFSSAKASGDLTKMRESINSLQMTFDNGRNEFKANIEKTKADTRNIGNEVINELAANADGEFRMRNVNTPESGNPMEKDILQNAGIFVEGMVGTHLQFGRVFGENSIITKIFYKPFVNAQSKTEVTKIELFKKLAEVKDGMRGHISGSHDSMMAKYTLWRNSNSTWGDGGVKTAAEYNRNNDMVFGLDKKGKWQYIPVSDTAKFKQKNAEKFANGTYVHFWDESPLKDEILDSVYAEFNNAYKNSPKFKVGEDYFRSHYDNVGKTNGGLMQRLYNKPFEVVNNYNPIAMWRKSSRDELVGTNGNLDNYYRESVDVSHTLSRTGPGEKVRMVLDPTEILTRHVHGAVYWGNVIEPLRNAQALLNVLKRGKSFLANPMNIDASIQRDLGTVGDDAFKTIPNVDADVKRIGIGDRIMSDEAVNFLETNLEKYATQGGNLGMKVPLGQDAIFTKSLSRTYQSLLTGIKTPFKQASSLADIYTAVGEKNSLSALRGVSNLDNLSLMVRESGIFAERIPNAISQSELGKTLRFDSSRTPFARAQDATEYLGSVVMGNLIKGFDGIASANAFLAGVSRHLDLNYPELHVAGRSLNLEDIKAKLVKTDELGNIIDDSEWREVITEGEIMMSKVMGSNAQVDTPLAVKGVLGKVTGFMGKSAINRMVSMWDTVIRGSLDKNLSSDSYKATDKLINVARFTLAGVMITAYNSWLIKQKDRIDVSIGAKAQDDIDIRNEKEAKSYMDEVSLIIDSQFFMPSIGVEIFKSFDPAVKYVNNFNKLQTTERKIQEGVESGIQTLFPLHNDIYNALKYGVTISSKMDFTNVGEAEFDKAATAVANQYGGNKSAKDYSPENDKWNGLSSVEQKILISKQIEFDKASAEKAKVEKPIKELQNKFVKDALNKYGKNITPQQLYDEAVANPEFAKTIEIKELESYYTKIQSAGAKTTGEKDSILMGKSTEAIFDVEIKPLMENGKAGDAFERVKQMRQKGIIKSDNGAINMIKLMKEYQDANKAPK